MITRLRDEVISHGKKIPKTEKRNIRKWIPPRWAGVRRPRLECEHMTNRDNSCQQRVRDSNYCKCYQQCSQISANSAFKRWILRFNFVNYPTFQLRYPPTTLPNGFNAIQWIDTSNLVFPCYWIVKMERNHKRNLANNIYDQNSTSLAARSAHSLPRLPVEGLQRSYFVSKQHSYASDGFDFQDSTDWKKQTMMHRNLERKKNKQKWQTPHCNQEICKKHFAKEHLGIWKERSDFTIERYTRLWLQNIWIILIHAKTQESHIHVE